eukprot:15354287-Ditylum_brightwellii.AAC.1
MGCNVRPNLGLDYHVLRVILDYIERDLLADTLDRPQKQFLLLVGFYLLICFIGSLCVNDSFMMELQGLLQHLGDGKKEPPELRYVVIAILGELKGKLGKCWHLLLLPDKTTSGFNP